MRHFEKKARYNQLSIDLRTEAGWKVHELCIEVGCRGHVGAEGWHSLCRTLGFTKVEKVFRGCRKIIVAKVTFFATVTSGERSAANAPASLLAWKN